MEVRGSNGAFYKVGAAPLRQGSREASAARGFFWLVCAGGGLALGFSRWKGSSGREASWAGLGREAREDGAPLGLKVGGWVGGWVGISG